MASDFDDLFADKGNVLAPGTVVVPGPRGKSADLPDVVQHQVGHVTYIDGAGHLHAVLIDEVTTIAGETGHASTHTVLEILSDVQVS